MTDFNNNEGLTEHQVSVKEKILIDIANEVAKSRNSDGQISKMPVHSNIEQFIDAVQQVINIDQEGAASKVILKDERAAGNIMEDPKNPGEDVSGVVLYSMERRAPGTMKGGNTPFNETRRELKPRVREVLGDSQEHPDEAKIIYSQWFDNQLCFKIVARRAHRANELALWFEELMECNRYFFAGRGITKYYFWERKRDEFQQLGNEPYFTRPLMYYVRTERSYELSEQTLNNIVVCLTSKK
jgi:hypothetical protein